MIGALTPRQRDMVNAIRKLTLDGVAPTFEDLRVEMNLASKSGVHRLIGELRERGIISCMPCRARSVRILGEMEGLDRRSDDDLRALRDQITTILRSRAQ